MNCVNEKNEIENVWYIEDNELKNANKVVCKTNYKGKEIAILKTERNWSYSDMLIKDKDNVYWKLNIAPIVFQNFITANTDIINGNKENTKNIEYCDDIVNALSKIDFQEFFYKMIKENRYFNKCQLKYISKHFPEMYEKAENSRNNFLNLKRIEEENRKKEIEKANIEQVEVTNEIFEDKLNKLKLAINLDKEIQIEDLVFYKENKYENGKTTQNSILYLAKQYGIKIPLATQGFINNRLVSYDFGNGSFAYKLTSNKKASVEMHKYLAQISKKVKEEFKNEQENIKEKIKDMKGRNK